MVNNRNLSKYIKKYIFLNCFLIFIFSYKITDQFVKRPFRSRKINDIFLIHRDVSRNFSSTPEK